MKRHNSSHNYIAAALVIALLILMPFSAKAQVSSAEGPPPVSVEQFTQVLWDQIGTPEGTGAASQNFTDAGGIFDIFDSRAADDFEVPEALGWNINLINVVGFYTGIGFIESLNIVFFTDNAGFPGDVVAGCEYLNVQPEDVTDPNFIVYLPEPCSLNSGIYWVSVQANMQFSPNGQWFWMSVVNQNLNLFAWENPLDGFGDGCTSWTAGVDCISNIGPDLSFQLIGEPFALPRPIPTLNQWALLAAAFLLGVIGLSYTRKRRMN